ncbi:MAG: hypothetical protein INR71_10460, partial [Terriglobus roseus]|nr:hypothetical protein [Terriglobus roseus]
KDDRDADKISYAATNLVKPNLRSRQQSEPPISRNVFPPTPPPEVDARPPPPKEVIPDNGRVDGSRPAFSANKIRPLDLSVAGFERPRLGTVRSASERPRGTRERELERQRSYGNFRAPTLQERRHQRKLSAGADDRAPSPEEVYDMYASSGNGNGIGGGSSSSRRPKNTVAGAAMNGSSSRIANIEEVAEEDEDGEDSYDDGYNEADFEMLPATTTNGRSARSARSDLSSYRSTGASASSASSTAPAHRRQPSVVRMTKIRVKVHAEDTRYVMISPNVGFGEFVDQIRAKFGLRVPFKIKIRDEEDFVTMADRDDLEMAIQNSKSEARRQRAEMGKMEVSLASPQQLIRVLTTV